MRYCDVEFCLGKITTDKQSKLIKTSTSQEALLEIPTTSTFTEEVSEHINEPNFQCSGMMGFLRNKINSFKIRCVEFEKRLTAATEKLKNIDGKK